MIHRSADGVLRAAQRLLPQLSVVHVVTALNRIAKCPDGRDVLSNGEFIKLLELATSGTSYALDGITDTRGLANLAWSFATLALGDEPLLHSIAAAALRKLSDFG